MYLKEDLSNFNFFFIYFFLKGIQMKIMKILIKKKQKKKLFTYCFFTFENLINSKIQNI
jgi:hypothetical protein